MPEPLNAAEAAIIGAIVSGGFAVITILIGRFFDERRDARQIAIQAAIEAWKVDVERAKATGGFVWDIDTYIMGMVGLSKISQKWFLTDHEYRMAIRAHFERNRIIGEEINRIRKVAQQSDGANSSRCHDDC